MQDPTVREHLQRLTHVMEEQVPFHKALGLKFPVMEPGRVEMVLPFNPLHVGDPIRPALHGGVIATLADVCGGSAVWTVVGPEDRVSTIDLRVDYLLPAPLEPLHAHASVLRVGNRVGVAAVRITAESRPDEVIAEGKGVYAIKRAQES